MTDFTGILKHNDGKREEVKGTIIYPGVLRFGNDNNEIYNTEDKKDDEGFSQITNTHCGIVKHLRIMEKREAKALQNVIVIHDPQDRIRAILNKHFK